MMDHWEYTGHKLMIEAAPTKEAALEYIENNIINDPLTKIDLRTRLLTKKM